MMHDEASIDPWVRPAVTTQGRQRTIRHVREDKVDLRRPAKHEHVAAGRAEPIPLLRERAKARHEPRQIGYDGRNVIDLTSKSQSEGGRRGAERARPDEDNR
jgi:hypothetical protein